MWMNTKLAQGLVSNVGSQRKVSRKVPDEEQQRHVTVFEGPEIHCQVREIRRSFYGIPRFEVKWQSSEENQLLESAPTLRHFGVKTVCMPDPVRGDIVQKAVFLRQ